MEDTRTLDERCLPGMASILRRVFSPEELAEILRKGEENHRLRKGVAAPGREKAPRKEEEED